MNIYRNTRRHIPILALTVLILVSLACGETTSTNEPRVSTATSETVETQAPSEQATNTPEPATAPTDTPEPEPTSTPEPVVSTEELKEKWRVPFRAAVLTVGAYEYLLETADKLEAGEIDDAAVFGELIGPGILLMGSEGILSEWEPAPDQKRYKDAIQNYVSTVQEVIAQWSDEEITHVDVPGLLENDYVAIQDTLQSIREDMKDDGLSDDDIKAMLDDLMEALEDSTGTPTPEAPSPAFEPFPSGGLGMSKDQWEQGHTETGTELGMTVYDGGAYLVMFVDEKIQYLEPTLDELSIEEARALAEAILPEDRQFVETYSPEGLAFLTVDLYMSEALKDRFASDWFIGGDPGNFIAVYGDDDDDGRVERIVIATGNNP